MPVNLSERKVCQIFRENMKKKMESKQKTFHLKTVKNYLDNSLFSIQKMYKYVK